MSLTLAYEQCVRTRAVAASCQACLDVCPHGAITLGGPKHSVQVELDRCTGCGLCQGECPTNAFSGAMDVPAWMAALPKGELTLGCGRGVDCLGAVSTEDLVTLALHHGVVRVDMTGCARCKTTTRPRGAYATRVASAQAFLFGIGSSAAVHTVVSAPGAVQPVAQDRRGFLSRLVPGGLSKPSPGARLTLDLQALNPQLLRTQAPTHRRERLKAALKQVPPTGRAGPVEAVEVSFTSSKLLNTTTCTVCNLCVTTCPTGAITSSRLKDELRFDAAACVKCGTCHDVCEPFALTLAPRVDTAQFLGGVPGPLGRLAVKNCGECGMLFRYNGGDVLCPRCADQDLEAQELSGVTRGDS
jgi:energy-converting hydrogenase A subunit P